MFSILRRSCIIFSVAMLLASAGAYAESWSSFKFADFTGISATPEFSTGKMMYNLALSHSPTITFDGKTYNISWIQGFYALSSNGINTFHAKGANILDDKGKAIWTWDTSPNNDSQNNYVVAGWRSQGNNGERITPDSNMSFTYTDFVTNNTSIILGLHVGYYDAGAVSVVTKFFKPNNTPPPSVPEAPASLLVALGGPLMGAISLIRKRFAR